MGQFPWGSVPTSLQEDDQAAAFLEDIRLLLRDIQTMGERVIMRAGSGSPEGVITARPGSLFFRTDGGIGTTLYVKESGTSATGWIAK